MRKYFFFFALFLFGCSGNGDGGADGTGFGPSPVAHVPEVSSFSLSPVTATLMQGDGTLVVTAEIGFRDTGLDIQALWVQMPDGARIQMSESFATETGMFTETIAMPTNQIGAFPVEVWLVDEAGDSSSHATAEFRVKSSTGPDGFPIRITESIDGLPPNGPSVNGGLDWDGGFVTFASKASNLVPGDTNDAYDLFIRDTCIRYIPDPDCAMKMTRVVMGVGGAEPNGDIGWTDTSPEGSLAVSFNGRYVAFVSSASNLVPDDTNGVDDVFLLDTCIEAYPFAACTPGVIRISVGNAGVQATAPASYPAVADDGRYVVFVSGDPNLVAGDTNGVADVFLRDTCRGVSVQCTPSTTRVSVTNAGGQPNGASGEPVFTGRYVAFSSLASNLVPEDTNGLQDVFIRDTCLGESGCVPSTRLVSVGYLNDPADGASGDPQVSWPLADFYGHDQHGRFVAFVSSATNLVVDDTNGASDVFERDFCAGEPNCAPSTARISLTSTNEQIMGDSWGPDFLRWDGEAIPFVTDADGVVSGDMNGVADVYVRHHCPTGAPSYCSRNTLRVSIGSGGTATDDVSYAPRLSHHFYTVWPITYISRASNILPETVAIPNHGSIYMEMPAD
jgi:archaellum component FlaF (FlaF/FlaG flagellin family)